MGDFFKGWRRKMGCATLLMALVFMGLWIRSLGNMDELQVPGGDKTSYFVSSWGGRFSWTCLDSGPMPFSFQTQRRDTDSVNQLFAAIGIRWTSGWLGFCRGESTAQGLRIWTIPSWSITVPLTLLSAYLILWKPRKRE